MSQSAGRGGDRVLCQVARTGHVGGHLRSFRNRVRGTAVSVAVGALWIASFILIYTFPALNARVGPAGRFWIYAGVCAAGFIFVLLRLPETKGKALEEIERSWGE